MLKKGVWRAAVLAGLNASPAPQPGKMPLERKGLKAVCGEVLRKTQIEIIGVYLRIWSKSLHAIGAGTRITAFERGWS